MRRKILIKDKKTNTFQDIFVKENTYSNSLNSFYSRFLFSIEFRTT